MLSKEAVGCRSWPVPALEPLGTAVFSESAQLDESAEGLEVMSWGETGEWPAAPSIASVSLVVSIVMVGLKSGISTRTIEEHVLLGCTDDPGSCMVREMTKLTLLVSAKALQGFLGQNPPWLL